MDRLSATVPRQVVESIGGVHLGSTDAGRFRIKMNQHGAVSKIDPVFGLKPGEFDFVCPYAEGRTWNTFKESHSTSPWTITPHGSHRLWVREAWGLYARGDETDWLRGSVRGIPVDSLRVQYNLALRADWGPLQDGCFWRPGIFMPRWASRITLEITEVRVQRLQEISDDDAKSEGVEPYTPPTGHISPDQRVPGPGFDDCRLGDQPHRLPFADLWDKINGKPRPMLDDEGITVRDDEDKPIMVAPKSWTSNPWVWAITFKMVP